MKHNWIAAITGLFCLIASNLSSAAHLTKDNIPIQPYITAEDDLLSFIPPFKMVSESIGFIFSNASFNGIELKMEMPFYEEKKALGFDCSVYRCFNRLNSVNALGPLNSQNSSSSLDGAMDVLLTYKKSGLLIHHGVLLQEQSLEKWVSFFLFLMQQLNHFLLNHFLFLWGLEW